MTNLFTIGFTRKSAADFFTRLRQAGVDTVIDTRLNNKSQLAGFAKQDDLRFFLREIGGINYKHELSLAPTQDILDAYKKKKMSWEEYSEQYLALLKERQIETQLTEENLENACFLCSEDQPHFCHRRLAAEYLKNYFETLTILHL
ncbi:MAG: DUF488 family protein [Cyanobacteria bacterium RI_101]|nr:DUF488 family protein [Cyanobacteria bacterium RI_101]